MILQIRPVFLVIGTSIKGDHTGVERNTGTGGIPAYLFDLHAVQGHNEARCGLGGQGPMAKLTSAQFFLLPTLFLSDCR